MKVIFKRKKVAKPVADSASLPPGWSFASVAMAFVVGSLVGLGVVCIIMEISRVREATKRSQTIERPAPPLPAQPKAPPPLPTSRSQDDESSPPQGAQGAAWRDDDGPPPPSGKSVPIPVPTLSRPASKR